MNNKISNLVARKSQEQNNTEKKNKLGLGKRIVGNIVNLVQKSVKYVLIGVPLGITAGALAGLFMGGGAVGAGIVGLLMGAVGARVGMDLGFLDWFINEAQDNKLTSRYEMAG